MKHTKLNLLTMSVWTRIALAVAVLVLLWGLIAWALGGQL